MFFKFVFISFIYFKYVYAVLHNFDQLHRLPLLSNYMTIKRAVYLHKDEPSSPNIGIINKSIYDKIGYDHHLLKYVIDSDDRRKHLFDSHTDLLNSAQNLTHLNILITHFINGLLVEYTLFFFELIPSLYLFDELRGNLLKFLETFEGKLIELFKVSMLSIIDVSPRSRILILLKSIQFRIMVEKMAQLCEILGFDYEFEKLEHVIATTNDERLSRIATWSVVHSEVFKKGLVMLSRTFIIASLNNFIVPLLFGFISKLIPLDFPGYSIIQIILKSFNITFN